METKKDENIAVEEKETKEATCDAPAKPAENPNGEKECSPKEETKVEAKKEVKEDNSEKK